MPSRLYMCEGAHGVTAKSTQISRELHDIITPLPEPRPYPGARNVRYRLGLIVVCITVVILVFGLSAIWIDTPFIRSVLLGVVGVYLVVATLRLEACLIPRPHDPALPTQDTDMDWPDYTVLVPLFRETQVIDSLVYHLSRLDYPKDKLEIVFICESDDGPTLTALKDYLHAPFSLVQVPRPGSEIRPLSQGPRTKPNALNYALERTQGALVTIYDAEDRPARKQLKTAARAFAANPHWDALQAPLRFYNAETNGLTRQFALEYAALFYVWVPFLARLGCPFPLGGTSNHIRRRALEAIGGWDAYNVTEDADLSFRLALQGPSKKGRLGFINPPTDEEIVIDWRAWTDQRARWMKGFMQTYNVHMLPPFAPGGRTGLLRVFTLNLTLGLTLVSGFFNLPFFLILCVSRGISVAHGHPVFIPDWFLYALGLGYGSGVLCGVVGAIRSRQYSLLRSVPLMPVYWLALFRPTLQALYELWARPFHWHKTEHGVTDTPIDLEN